jgi:integrase
MSSQAKKPPKYCLHKSTGRAFMLIDGRPFYLGKHGTAESQVRYAQKLAELGQQREHEGDAPPPFVLRTPRDLTVNELLLLYMPHAEQHYQKSGSPTRSIDNVRLAVRPLKELGGSKPVLVREFGPLMLKSIREGMVAAKLSRGVINERVRIIREVFRWGVENELVPASILHALEAVRGLQKGRTSAREPTPVLPVDDAAIDATLPHLPAIVADMVRLQRLTGARPGEICILRPGDVKRDADVWEYRPATHKTEHHGRERVIFIGPKAQAVLRPYLLRAADAFCFSPAESEAKRRAEQRDARKSKVQPSQQNRRKPNPLRTPRQRYTKDGYHRAIQRACDQAFPPPEDLSEDQAKAWRREHRWSPHRVRHTVATEIRRLHGIEAAQVTLGHARADVTQVYAERDLSKAAMIMRQLG